MSLPGVAPLMVINGELHIDGGLINNLWIDVMRNWLRNNAKNIDEDLFSDTIDKIKYNFTPELTFLKRYQHAFDQKKRQCLFMKK
jgi:hypothetical protein